MKKQPKFCFLSTSSEPVISKLKLPEPSCITCVLTTVPNGFIKNELTVEIFERIPDNLRSQASRQTSARDKINTTSSDVNLPTLP